MNSRSVVSYTGISLEILGISMLVPILISWIYAEDVFVPYALGALISLGFGFVLSWKFERQPLDLSSAMVLTILAFLVVSLIGTIPYANYLNPVDSLFESVSGFTTTGLTTLNPENLPKSLVFWRSLTQWLGGAGILVIALMLLSSPGSSSYYLYRSEGVHRVGPGEYAKIKRLLLIFSIFTVAGIAMLASAGMTIFDAIIHGFSAISTGGFSSKVTSIGFYSSSLIEFIIVILTILGATSFFIHDKIFRGKFLRYVRNGETKTFWVLAVVGSVLVSLSLLNQANWLTSGIFHTFSALTTSGFYTSSYEFSGLTKILMALLMIVGGFAGSTAGGLKLVRIGIFGKSITWLAKRVSSPLSAVIPVKFDGRIIKEQELSIISMFSLIYVIVLVVSSLGLSSLGYSPIDSFYVAASAEGNVGLSSIDIPGMDAAGKTILMTDMIIGRLEILPFLFLIFILYRRLPIRMRHDS